MKVLLTLCLIILLCLPYAPDAFAQTPANQEANPASPPTQAVPPGKTPSSPEASSTPSPTSPATEPQAALNETNNEASAPRFVSKDASVRITRFETPPTVDGQINEREWVTAAHFGDFVQTQPGDNVAPSQPTEVMMGYDAKHLYLAFRAREAKGKVRSTVARRDNIFDDDTVRVVLDTFDDQRQGYIFVFNPLGIQADGVLTEGRGEDYSVDIVMESKGVMTEDGYTVEVAIPFKSLRYEAGKSKSWGIHIFRRIKHNNNELDSWMPISRNRSGLLNQAGHITGLEGISTTRQLEIIPSLTLSQTGTRVRTIPVAETQRDPTLRDSGKFVNGGLDFDPGLTAKFGLTPTVTLDFALNPDFAQVEADATVVTANQRFPIFFPEKRPFFLERIDIFQTRLSVVNTRAIVDPDVAVKLTGRRGANTFGILAASDNFPGFGAFTEDQRTDPTLRRGIERFLDKNSYVGIFRLKRDIGRQHNLGVIATSYSFPERHNHTGGFDGRFRLDPQTIVEFQVLGTTSRRFFFDADLGRSLYRTGNGFGYSYLFDRTGRNLSVQFNGVGRTRDYRADVGFTPRTNTNQHRSFIRYVTEQQPKQRIIFKRLFNETVTSFDWQGRLQNWETNTQGMLALQRQTFIGGGTEFGYERVFEEEFGAKRSATRAGTFLGEDSERSAYSRELYCFIETSPNKQFFGLFVIGYTQGQLDFDFGAGPRFPRVSPAALINPNSALDPGKGDSLFIESSFRYQPTNLLRLQLDYNKQRLVREDTNLTAFDDNIFSLRGTYQFTRNTFARARLDYSTLATLVRPQLLLGYTPNPGTALFIGYNDDLNRNGFNPFSREPVLEPGFRRNGRTFFIKASYLFRKEF
ncbi:MAG: DUF5916 domain-containing protein [Pyrinomonadaceae bacterium MAG19_C2-C3]|nr:DUF5916 domain-containing protein [Pyrinomonadaceae bacterium MAG19_C2-C3]